MSDFAGEKDCGRRFKVGEGYKGCQCAYHVRRRQYAEKYRREQGVEPKEQTGRKRTRAEAVREWRASQHGGTVYCEEPDCGAGPFKSRDSLPIHYGLVHREEKAG